MVVTLLSLYISLKLERGQVLIGESSKETKRTQKRQYLTKSEEGAGSWCVHSKVI